MGIGPVPSTSKVLDRLHLQVSDLGLVELNEAFAAQSLAVLRELKIDAQDDRLNTLGGAIALGHPLGSSGGRLMATLVHELRRRGGGFGSRRCASGWARASRPSWRVRDPGHPAGGPGRPGAPGGPWRTGRVLRSLHSSLLDAVKGDYERQHGPVGGPFALFRLVTGDPFFAWLRPLSGQMALIDELIDEKRKLDPRDARGVRAAVELLFTPEAASPEGFAANYVSRLQSVPEVATLHGELRAALDRLPREAEA
jgi:hypothetical protein